MNEFMKKVINDVSQMSAGASYPFAVPLQTAVPVPLVFYQV